MQDTTSDLNEDGAVNSDDLTHLVVVFLGTAAGDENLDLIVDRADVVSLLSNFARPGPSGWTESDFSGDLKTGIALSFIHKSPLSYAHRATQSKSRSTKE